jgi:hypothetical protein
MSASDTPHAVEALGGAHGTADAFAKVLVTLQARAALAGFSLTRLADGTWCIARWDQYRELSTVADVERFLRRVEGTDGRIRG